MSSRSRPCHPVRAHLAKLSATSLAESIDAAAASIADFVAGRRYPRKAISALLRHHGNSLSRDLRERLLDIVMTELERRRNVAPTAPPPTTGHWRSVREAALDLRLTEQTLLDRLRSRDHRRRLGWPRWDGYQWWLSSRALDPGSAAAFLASLPEAEPLQDLLPAWCER